MKWGTGAFYCVETKKFLGFFRPPLYLPLGLSGKSLAGRRRGVVSLAQQGEEGRTHGTENSAGPLCPQPQRTDAPGQPVVSAAGLAQRPEPGGRDGAAAGGPGPGPVYPGLVRPGDAGSGVAWTHLGQRAGVPVGAHRGICGGFPRSGGAGPHLPLLLHPG